MTGTTVTDAAKAAVNELIEALGWLAANLLPGTGLPYRPPSMTPEARAERDRLARLEWLERSGLAPGESPAPLDLAVADLLSEICATADELADLVSDTARVGRMPSAPSAFTDPEPYLIHVTDLLPACARDLRVAASIEAACDNLTFRTNELLGLIGDGQVLDATCPWCAGRTSRTPAGGERTLRVRAVLPAGARNFAKVDPLLVRWLVVCESGWCEPPTADYGERHRGRPAWPLRTEGEWLAQRIERALVS